MKFLIVNGTLTENSKSNTYTLCEMVKLGFEKLGHECEIATMRDMKYTNGTDDFDDDIRYLIQKMFKVDGVVFATPIWWGGHSSHIQAYVERMDAIDDWTIENKFKPMYCKVFGDIVSGSGDGFQHIHGVLYNFATMLGMTVPPSCNIESAAQGRDNILKDAETIGMVKTFVTNMSVWAEALKDQKVKLNARHVLTEGKKRYNRIPRKKGQKKKSKKHSDLYTDEDPKGTIHGLGFKDEAAARSSVAKIRKSGRSHAHKIQAAVAMEQRARAAGKTGPAAVYRKFINSMKKKTKAKNKKK